MIRCKFRCESIQQFTADTPSQKSRLITFRAIVDGSVPEDEAFTKYTPSGCFQVTIDNPRALEVLEAGLDYYLDLSPVPGIVLMEPPIETDAEVDTGRDVDSEPREIHVDPASGTDFTGTVEVSDDSLAGHEGVAETPVDNPIPEPAPVVEQTPPAEHVEQTPPAENVEPNAS
jgi:hypothetical protein